MPRHETIYKLMSAAEELARDGCLNDPTDDDILIYSAEWIGDTTTDLSHLLPTHRMAIISSYDRRSKP